MSFLVFLTDFKQKSNKRAQGYNINSRFKINREHKYRNLKPFLRGGWDFTCVLFSTYSIVFFLCLGIYEKYDHVSVCQLFGFGSALAKERRPSKPPYRNLNLLYKTKQLPYPDWFQWLIYSGQNSFHLYLQSYKPCDSVPKLMNPKGKSDWCVLKITHIKQN